MTIGAPRAGTERESTGENGRCQTDRVLREYLLGAIAPELRDEVERRLFSDDRIYWERVGLAEDELIDDYVRGQLNEDERDRFDRVFLCSDERRAKLEFARAVARHAERGRVADRLTRWLMARVYAPSWSVAAAAVLLLAVVPGVVWQLASSRQEPAVVTSRLSPGQVRGVGDRQARLEIGPGCDTVRLVLDAEPGPPGGYAAVLAEITEGGEIEIWSQRRLAAALEDGLATVTLVLPCELLSEGDYHVRLSAVSPGESAVAVGRYGFRVVRH